MGPHVRLREDRSGGTALIVKEEPARTPGLARSTPVQATGPQTPAKPAPARAGEAPARRILDPRLEAYLATLGKEMSGMSSRAREGILGEQKAHMGELVAETGSVEGALKELEAPEKLGREFLGIYGYGPGYGAMFCTIGILLSIISIPVLNVLGVIGLAALFIYLVWVSIKAGKMLGLACGLGACIARIILVLALLAASPAVYELGDSASVWSFFIGSALLPLAGYLAGETKERYEKAKPVEF